MLTRVGTPSKSVSPSSPSDFTKSSSLGSCKDIKTTQHVAFRLEQFFFFKINTVGLNASVRYSSIHLPVELLCYHNDGDLWAPDKMALNCQSADCAIQTSTFVVCSRSAVVCFPFLSRREDTGISEARYLHLLCWGEHVSSEEAP